MSIAFKILTLSLISLSSLAQGVKRIKMEEVVALALENSKQMKLSDARKEMYHAKVAQLYNTLIPNIWLTSGYTRLSDNIIPFAGKFVDNTILLNPQILNQYTNRISAQQVIFAGGRAIETLEQAKKLELAEKLDADNDKSEIRFQVASVFLNLYKLQYSLQTVSENQKLFDQRLTDTKNLEKQGFALANDVLKIELSMSSLDVSKAEIEENITVASFNLALLTGLPTESLFEINTQGLFDPKLSQSEVQNINRALQQRSEIKAAKSRKQASESGINMARGNYYPVITAGANYYLNRPNTRQFPADDQFRNTWDFGVNLSYNLTAVYSTKSQMKEAQATAKQADILISQLEDAVKLDVKSSLAAFSLSLKKIELAQKTIVQARENQRVLKNRVKSETAMLTELTEADVALANAQINLIAAQTDSELAWYKLKRTTGE